MSDRLPLLLWGDLVKGGAPVLRRALAGARAHECMYAWVYLTEFLALDRLRALLPSLTPEQRRDFFPSLDGPLWTRTDRRALDPHFQVSRGSFESVACMAMLARLAGASAPQFVELGSTFFASRLRFALVDEVAREVFADHAPTHPTWVGIDNSPFMHDTTRLLHGADAVTLVSDTRDVPAVAGFSGLFSRFVASYVFPGAAAFLEFAAPRFAAVMIEDAYSTTGSDVHVHNHGQPETFFSLPDTLRGFVDHGFRIFILSSYPDHPAGSAPCHVVKYLAVKAPLAAAVLDQSLRDLGFGAIGREADPSTALAELNAKVSVAHWQRVERAKHESPVWGPTPEGPSAPDAGRATPASHPWGDHRLGGPQAEREIARATADELG